MHVYQEVIGYIETLGRSQIANSYDTKENIDLYSILLVAFIISVMIFIYCIHRCREFKHSCWVTAEQRRNEQGCVSVQQRDQIWGRGRLTSLRCFQRLTLDTKEGKNLLPPPPQIQLYFDKLCTFYVYCLNRRLDTLKSAVSDRRRKIKKRTLGIELHYV